MYTAHVHFFTNLDLFCIDNARVIYRKIRYLLTIVAEARVSSEACPRRKCDRQKGAAVCPLSIIPAMLHSSTTDAGARGGPVG